MLLWAATASWCASNAVADDVVTEEVVVTGSRIPADPLSAPQPVIQLDQTTVEHSGTTSTVELLQRLPLAGGGLNSKFNNSGNFGNPPDGGGVGAGAAEIDLRYLTSRRVLVLVDGLRWVPGSSASGVPGAVDLNTIPTAMIQRIEVLQEGASPVYGSDAIAGVVNIITKTSQDGMQSGFQWGTYDAGDGGTVNLDASWGASLEDTRIVAGGGFFDQDGVLAGDRDISRFPVPYSKSCEDGDCSSGTVLGRMIITDPNTGQELDMTLRHPFPPGTLPVYDPTNPTGAGSDFKDFETLDRFNYQPFNYVVIPSERENLFARIEHDFTDHLYLKVLGTYTGRKSQNQAAPLPLFVGPDAGNGNLLDTVSIDATNPYNPFGFTLGPGTYAFIGRRLVENGPRHYEQTVNTQNVSGTLGGDFTLNDKAWTWDVDAVWGRNHADQRFTGNVNAANVAQALGPAALCTGSCVPLNLFGGEGSITPEMLDFIAFTQHDVSEQELQDYYVNAAGDVFDLPAGALGLGVGYEHRRNSGFFEPDPIVAAGLSADIPAEPTKGTIDVDELYGELRIPLLSDQPFAHKLDLDVAGRWFDYSTSGWDSTYKVGLMLRPVQEVLVRGVWGQGFRAPTIGEAYGSASRFDQEVADPCSDMLGLAGGEAASPEVQANCIAQGVPADGSYTQINPQLPVFTRGNPLLDPETSESWTAGLVWAPSALKDTSWSSDASIEFVYTDLTLDGAIQTENAASLLTRCAETGDALACSAITRTASGAVAKIDNPLTNIGRVDTQAIDLNLIYSTPSEAWGSVIATWYTNFLLNYDERVPTESGFTTISREGTERGSPDQAYPRARSNLTFDWGLEQFGATLGIRYISSVRETASESPNTMDPEWYVDTQVRYKLPVIEQRSQIAVGVTNIFGEDPPGCFSCGLNNFDPNTYDPPGRFVYIRVDYKE